MIQRKDDRYRTADIKFVELCDEIDYWKSQAEYYKKQFEEVVQEQFAFHRERNESIHKDIANVLSMTLNSEYDEDGSLKISKENRENIVKNWKK